ncbi:MULTISPECIES: hypothetical protein [unclassified Streptomyces]|uniref:hypothetical protein n=1 Tax=unclassified Streptomyces TaxID=2593676 RepID=UPI000DD556B2|nr:MULTISPECIES: hypothetical protein [unclassified Streptomyces]QZZ32323.1 hypothetical protein A7X85_44475 [Streptomyces sp. ST1015]
MAKETKPKRTAPAARPITITAVVDAVGVLASDSTEGEVYFYDTNKAAGSTGFGTGELRTKVKRGDQLLWSTIALECEAHVAIAAIDIDSSVCEPQRKVYPGTDVSFWTATVKTDLDGAVPYRISFQVGTRTEPITAVQSPSLVG